MFKKIFLCLITTSFALSCTITFGNKYSSMDVKNRDENGRTPLHMVAAGPDDILELIKKGADVNAQDNKGRTPLHDAIFVCNVDNAKILSQHGANVNLKDDKGRIQLFDVAIMACMDKTIRPKKQIEIISLLIENKSEINIQDIYGTTPLHNLSIFSSPDVIETLINKGAKIDITDKKGQTPLHWAAKYGDYNSVEILIKKGSEINGKDLQGNTPLMLAQNSKKNKAEVTKILLDHGAK